MNDLYWIDVKHDGTWLHIDAGGCKASFHLESLSKGPIVLKAVAQLREVMLKRRAILYAGIERQKEAQQRIASSEHEPLCRSHFSEAAECNCRARWLPGDHRLSQK